ncbi:TetR/AcrR family transcriptional regulator [Pseudonocardia spinosispora]|uniref:TetR/AcrR family transcriptional regulator n=1 Tax=Pseudonocardia spinosispora TaxID=103441 RepID=UPI00040876F3|nr:TetR/AcrR family transcriptional regulator [Pseudonocardia spinosispora]
MARPRKFDEARVMRAVRDQFWSAGYAGTSLDDLTRVTGLGRGSLYGAFGDKHTLYLRAFGEYCTETVGEIRRRLSGPGDAYERLATHVREVAAAVASDMERRGCMMAKSTAELAATDPEVASRASVAFTDLHAALTDCVREAQRDGALSSTADAEALAGLLLAVLRGLEALGKGGVSGSLLTATADQALALLPQGPAKRRTL